MILAGITEAPLVMLAVLYFSIMLCGSSVIHRFPALSKASADGLAIVVVLSLRVAVIVGVAAPVVGLIVYLTTWLLWLLATHRLPAVSKMGLCGWFNVPVVVLVTI